MNYKHTYDTIKSELKKYLIENNLKSMVLGVSGGIDSTVCAAICHDIALETNIKFIARSLTIKNKKNEISSSSLAGKGFGTGKNCSYAEVNLNDIFTFTANGIKNAESAISDYKPTKISEGNIQARLRMIYLYNLAGINKGIVIDTDNLTEHFLGFFTIHGDMGDLSPIGGLWKTEIYGLAEWLKEKNYIYKNIEGAKALQAAIDIKPTDGLGISLTDLDQIGAKTYDEVDAILKQIIFPSDSNSVSKDELGISKITIKKVKERYEKTMFKRKHLPLIIKRGMYEHDIYTHDDIFI